MSGHTKGPWVVDRPKPSEVHVLGYEEGGTGLDRPVLVAACEMEADALLIVQAPRLMEENRELRAALRKARKHLVNLDSDASWMLHRSKQHWDENDINRTIGQARAFVQEIDAAFPDAGGEPWGAKGEALP